jgi:hypothetical protein
MSEQNNKWTFIHFLQKEICCEKEKLRHAVQQVGDFDELQKIGLKITELQRILKELRSKDYEERISKSDKKN